MLLFVGTVYDFVPNFWKRCCKYKHKCVLLKYCLSWCILLYFTTLWPLKEGETLKRKNLSIVQIKLIQIQLEQIEFVRKNLLLATLSSSWMLLSIEAGEMESCLGGWIFEFSSGNFPPGCPPLPLLFLWWWCSAATDEAGDWSAPPANGGEDEGVPGDPVNHILVKSLCLYSLPRGTQKYVLTFLSTIIPNCNSHRTQDGRPFKKSCQTNWIFLLIYHVCPIIHWIDYWIL